MSTEYASILGLVNRLKTIRLPIGGKDQGALHEQLVEQQIQLEGFIRVDLKATPEEKKNWEFGYSLYRLQPGQYVAQPFGTHGHPDFIVCDALTGEQRGVECKSSKEERPMYNSGWPPADVIYVFTTSKDIEEPTIVLLGGYILPEEVRAVIKERDRKAKEDDAITNAKLDALASEGKNPFGLGVYSRVQSTHRGSSETTGYFIPERRAVMEQDILSNIKAA